MTEKKKRGRPPGSTKKPKELSPEAKEAATISTNSLVEVMKREMRARGITPLIISAPETAKASEIITFPNGWDKMGKIDRLRYLTEQNAKK